MKVDDDTLIEIKENTAVTREKVEQLENKLDSKDQKISKNSERISDNNREIARIKAVGGFLTLIATIIAGMHGWIVPFL